MSHTFYSEINLHLTWHVKHNRPALTPELEKVAHDAIRLKALSFRGVVVHAVNGTEDHIHLAVSIPPTVLISEFVGQVKGYSSHAINEAVAGQGERFAWQTGYGVVSFGTGDLQWVVQYIEKQKEHHAKNKTFDRLEQVPAEAAQSDAVAKGNEKDGGKDRGGVGQRSSRGDDEMLRGGDGGPVPKGGSSNVAIEGGSRDGRSSEREDGQNDGSGHAPRSSSGNAPA